MSVRIPIVVWVSSFGAGGTERQMVHLIRGLDPDRFAVHAACFDAHGPWLDAARSRAESIAEFPMRHFRRPETWRQARHYAKWCRRQGIAAVITSDFYTNVFGLIGAAIAGVPVRIGGRREINTDKSGPKLLLQRAAYALAHCVVANSQAAAVRLVRERVGQRAIRVVPNGIHLPDRAPRRRERILRAITVANLRPEKGHDVLIDALASTPALSALRIDVVGDGSCRAALEARAHARGVADRISFLGERHDIPNLLDDADLFILPSRTEAFPNSVMEAMAAALPVIACRVGGVPELIEDGVTGILVPPDDPAALGAAIAGMAADASRAASMGAAARAAVAERFSMARMIAGFTDILLEQLNQRTARANVGERLATL